MRVVKDLLKANCSRPFFVCSGQSNPCAFWIWGDVRPIGKPECRHGFQCVVRKLKKNLSTKIVYSFVVLNKIHAITTNACPKSLFTNCPDHSRSKMKKNNAQALSMISTLFSKTEHIYNVNTLFETFIVKCSTFYCCKQLYNIYFKTHILRLFNPSEKALQ